MIKAAIEKILTLAPPCEITHNGRKYTDKPLHMFPTPHTEPVRFHTLEGLTNVVLNEYVNYPSGLMVKVDECSVAVLSSEMDPYDLKRDVYYEAEADVPTFSSGKYISYEEMMIALKSKFVSTPQRDELIKTLGTIVEENHTAISDDGFSQSVNVKQGIAFIGSKIIDPIVKLKPYRTFVEVEQPESEFLVRLRSGGEVALFEADGGAWKLTARANTAKYLRERLEKEECADIIVVE